MQRKSSSSNIRLRKTSSQYDATKRNLSLQGFTVSGLVGIKHYDFKCSNNKLVLIGDTNTHKSTLDH